MKSFFCALEVVWCEAQVLYAQRSVVGLAMRAENYQETNYLSVKISLLEMQDEDLFLI